MHAANLARGGSPAEPPAGCSLMRRVTASAPSLRFFDSVSPPAPLHPVGGCGGAWEPRCVLRPAPAARTWRYGTGLFGRLGTTLPSLAPGPPAALPAQQVHPAHLNTCCPLPPRPPQAAATELVTRYNRRGSCGRCGQPRLAAGQAARAAATACCARWLPEAAGSPGAPTAAAAAAAPGAGGSLTREQSRARYPRPRWRHCQRSSHAAARCPQAPAGSPLALFHKQPAAQQPLQHHRPPAILVSRLHTQ